LPAEANLPPAWRVALLKQRIYDIIRRSILTGQLAPGMTINVRATALALGVFSDGVVTGGFLPF
jgi:DNA-binding GntR family transcriptional regulator